MVISELLASVGNKEMSRKDFLKFILFIIASIVGVKNLLSLLAGVNMHPNLTYTKKPKGLDGGSSYNSGRYNR